MNQLLRTNDSSKAIDAIPLNKTAQFLFGLLIIFVAFKLWWSGWFSMRLMQAVGVQSSAPEGVGSVAGLLPLVLDSVCLIGILGFSGLSMVRGLVEHLLRRFGDANRVEQTDRTSIELPAFSRQIDPAKLQNALQGLQDRIGKLESLHPDAFPVLDQEPPSIEQLALQIRELHDQLSGSTNDSQQESS